jgi:hypothetical protein
MPEPMLLALRQALAGEATADERAALAAWMRDELGLPDVTGEEPVSDAAFTRVSGWVRDAVGARAALDDALVADGVMEIIGELLLEGLWAPALRDAVLAPIDVCDGVFAALDALGPSLAVGPGAAVGSEPAALAPVFVMSGLPSESPTESLFAGGEAPTETPFAEAPTESPFAEGPTELPAVLAAEVAHPIVSDAPTIAAPAAALEADPDREAMEIAAFADGEVPDAVRAEVARRLLRDASARAAITAQAELGAALRAAVGDIQLPDVWFNVAGAIGVESDPATAPLVPANTEAEVDAGWLPIAAALREAVRAPAVDVAPVVLASVTPYTREMPRWASLWAPLAAFAAAAAVLVSLVPSPPDNPTPPVQVAFALGAVNDAQMEEVEYADGVVGGVISPEEVGDVMIIVMDDSALAAVEPGPSEGAHL